MRIPTQGATRCEAGERRASKADAAISDEYEAKDNVIINFGGDARYQRPMGDMARREPV